MNWYKKAQLNREKIRYQDKDNVYILGKNTRLNQGPWRISWLWHNRPAGHEHYPTYEIALEKFNEIEGVEGPPDLNEYQINELITNTEQVHELV